MRQVPLDAQHSDPWRAHPMSRNRDLGGELCRLPPSPVAGGGDVEDGQFARAAVHHTDMQTVFDGNPRCHSESCGPLIE